MRDLFFWLVGDLNASMTIITRLTLNWFVPQFGRKHNKSGEF